MLAKVFGFVFSVFFSLLAVAVLIAVTLSGLLILVLYLEN